MGDTIDTAQVIIRPPLAWGLAVIAGLALNWLMPLPFLPAALPAGWPGAMVFVLALALVAWAIVTMTKAGSSVPTNLPTASIVESGPYRLTRNPISAASSAMSIVAIARAYGAHVTMQRDCSSPSPSDYTAKRSNPHGMGLLGPCAITMKMAENTPASTKLPKRAARMGIR
jgi:hypothetical protein